MTAATLTRTISVDEESCEFPHVLDGVALNGAAAHLAGGLDRGLLDEAGWDPVMRVLYLPAQHRLLGRKVCRVETMCGDRSQRRPRDLPSVFH